MQIVELCAVSRVARGCDGLRVFRFCRREQAAVERLGDGGGAFGGGELGVDVQWVCLHGVLGDSSWKSFSQLGRQLSPGRRFSNLSWLMTGS